VAKTQRGKKAGKAKTSARAGASRAPRSTAKTTRPAPAERKAPRSAEAPVRAASVHAPRAASTESRGKYVYCIIRVDDPMKFGPIGTITHRVLRFVVLPPPTHGRSLTVPRHQRATEA